MPVVYERLDAVCVPCRDFQRESLYCGCVLCFNHDPCIINSSRPFTSQADRTQFGSNVCNVLDTVMLLLGGLPARRKQPPVEEVVDQNRSRSSTGQKCCKSIHSLHSKGGDFRIICGGSCAARKGPKQGTNRGIHVAVVTRICKHKRFKNRPQPNTRSSNFTRFGGLRKPSRRNETPDVCREELPWSLVRLSKRAVASVHRNPTSISTGTDCP